MRNLRSKRPSTKLDFKKYRLFRIVRKVVTFNFELDLLTTIRVRTKVFYVLLLELALKKVLLKKKVEVKVDEEEFDVEEVLDLCYRGRILYYFVKWLNYGLESNF